MSKRQQPGKELPKNLPVDCNKIKSSKKDDEFSEKIDEPKTNKGIFFGGKAVKSFWDNHEREKYTISTDEISNEWKKQITHTEVVPPLCPISFELFHQRTQKDANNPLENKNQNSMTNSYLTSSFASIKTEKDLPNLMNPISSSCEELAKKEKDKEKVLIQTDNKTESKNQANVSQEKNEPLKKTTESKNNINPFFTKESCSDNNSSVVNPFINNISKNPFEVNTKNPFSFNSSPLEVAYKPTTSLNVSKPTELKSQLSNPFSTPSNYDFKPVLVSSNNQIQNQSQNAPKDNSLSANPFASEVNKFHSAPSSMEESKRKEKITQFFSGPHISEIEKEDSDNDENADKGYDPEAEEDDSVQKASIINHPQNTSEDTSKLFQIELASLAVFDQWKGEGIISISKTTIPEIFSIVYRNKMQKILFEGILTKNHCKSVQVLEQKGSMIAKIISIQQNIEKKSQHIIALFCKFRSNDECEKFVSQINQLLK